MVANDSVSKDNRIENLLPENYKKGSLTKKSFGVKAQTNKDIRKIKTKYVFCNEEIEFLVNLKEIATKGKAGFKTECPHCGNTTTVNVSPKTWKCEHCSEEFETKKEAEGHEKACSRRTKG